MSDFDLILSIMQRLQVNPMSAQQDALAFDADLRSLENETITMRRYLRRAKAQLFALKKASI